MTFKVILHFSSESQRPPVSVDKDAEDPQAAFDLALASLSKEDRQQVAYGELYPMEQSGASTRMGVSAKDVFDQFLCDDGRGGKIYLRHDGEERYVVRKSPDGEVYAIVIDDP